MPKKVPRKKTRVARKTPSTKTPRTSTRSTSTRSTRPRQAMPAFVRQALQARRLLEQYRQRPAYQRNDYLGWIAGAKREETRLGRLAQMLEELAKGDRYMKMVWRPRGPA